MAMLALGAAALATALLTPVAARLAKRLGGVDRPGGRRHHAETIPRMGGVAIAAGVVSGVLVATFLSGGMHLDGLVTDKALAFLTATILIFGLGAADDLRKLGVRIKFAVQVLAATIVVASGTFFEVVRLPFLGEVYLGVLAPLITIVWIVGVTNAMNLLDGLDGLAAGLTTIIAVGVCILFVLRGADQRAVVVVAATAGACAGFLIYNWHPAKIFMGDSGSLTLGFILSVAAVHCGVKSSTAVAAMIPILALGLPVFDTLLVMAYRFTRSRSRPPLARAAGMFEADRNHLHFLLGRLIKSRRHVVLALYAAGALFTTMALLVAMTGSPLLGLVSLALGGLTVLIVRQAGLSARLRDAVLAERAAIRAELEEQAETTGPALVEVDRAILYKPRLSAVSTNAPDQSTMDKDIGG